MGDFEESVFFPSSDDVKRRRTRESDRKYERRHLRTVLRAWLPAASIDRLGRQADEESEFNFNWFNRELQCPVNIHTCRIANVQLRPLVDSRQMRRTRVWELFFQFKRYYGDERVAMIFPVSDMGDFVIHDDVSIPPQPGVNTIVRRARTPSKVLHVLPFKAFVSGLKEIWSPEGL